MAPADARATMLTTDEVLAILAEHGQPVAADTWRSYVSRGQAPAPARHVGRTPLWDRAAVEVWLAGRRARRARG